MRVLAKYFLTLLLLVSLCYGASAQPVKGLIVSDSANLCVVKVWGTHYERGYAYGFLCAPKIKSMYEGYYKKHYGKYLKLAHAILSAGLYLDIDREYVQEAQGVLAGMESAGIDTKSMDYIDLLTGNCLLDLLNGLEKLNNSGMGCSSLMSWGSATLGTDLDGASCITRMLDWELDPVLIENQVMVAHIPSETDEQPWIMIGFAGQISALSGINRHMGAFQHVMFNIPSGTLNSRHYEPIWFSLRKALEKNDYNHDHHYDTRDLQAVLSEHPQGYACSCIISCLAGTAHNRSHIAEVAEIAPVPPYLTFRDNRDEDAIEGDNLYAANNEIKRNNRNYFCSRYRSIIAAMNTAGPMSSSGQWQMMAGHSVTSSSLDNIQMMQFIPDKDLLLLAVNKHGRPAYMNPPDQWSVSGLLSHPTSVTVTPSLVTVSLWHSDVARNIRVSIPHAKNGDITIRISDVAGKLLIESSLNEYRQGQRMLNLPLVDIKPGVYLFQVRIADRNAYGKFMVHI